MGLRVVALRLANELKEGASRFRSRKSKQGTADVAIPGVRGGSGSPKAFCAAVFRPNVVGACGDETLAEFNRRKVLLKRRYLACAPDRGLEKLPHRQ
jgi:hypothetical protein